MRLIIITGAPRTGKTTLAGKLGPAISLPVVNSDDFLHLGHANIPEALVQALYPAGTLLEGTHAARLLSRGIQPDLLICCRGPSENDSRYKGITAWVLRNVQQFQARHPDRVVQFTLERQP
jgi:adenylate kinase family enzyme